MSLSQVSTSHNMNWRIFSLTRPGSWPFLLKSKILFQLENWKISIFATRNFFSLDSHYIFTLLSFFFLLPKNTYFLKVNNFLFHEKRLEVMTNNLVGPAQDPFWANRRIGHGNYYSYRLFYFSNFKNRLSEIARDFVNASRQHYTKVTPTKFTKP